MHLAELVALGLSIAVATLGTLELQRVQRAVD